MRKRNAVSQFSRRHPGYKVLPLSDSTSADALSVARGWLDAALAEGRDDVEGLRSELAAIALALSPGCKALAALPVATVAAHARAIAPKVAAYVAAHPRMLHPWRDDYHWLCDL